MRRIAVALVIAAVVYGVSAGVGLALHATGTIATGATHNECPDFRRVLAEERDEPLGDVPQELIRERTIECLEEHEQTEDEALRTEFLVWPAWAALVCGLVYLVWPAWARILHNQEMADPEMRDLHGGEQTDLREEE